jgi:hypothetical protein
MPITGGIALMRALTRTRLLQLALATTGALLVDPRVALAQLRAPSLARLSVRNAGRRYAGDRRLFASVSPGVAGRDTASVAFSLDRRATVRLDAVRSETRKRATVWGTQKRLGPGDHSLSWTPSEETPCGTYLMRLTVEDEDGKQRTYGVRRPVKASLSTAPVVRVLGVEAAFEKRSYAPGQPARLTVTADADRITLQFLACGTEAEYTERPDEMSGQPVDPPRSYSWAKKRSAPHTIVVNPGPWASGLYAAKLTTDDGRVGFAPLILRPTTLGAVREAVVMPTNTWQAYNFDDADGDGWGDTWYAGGSPPVRLNRPYRQRGTPPWFGRRDAPFLKFLHNTGRKPDMLAEDDLEALPSGDELRRLYDLVVFPGHTEYVTEHAYNIVQRFRDLGGRLIFLSANNFFWKVEKSGQSMRRLRLWRDLGRPESALMGVQYRANDDGSRQGVFKVTNTAGAPWLFEGTGLVDGGTFGDVVGGFGIEIDQTTPFTPANTIVLAEIPNLYGPGLTAQMTYYETEQGARVFSAGVLDFGGSAPLWPVRRMLDNLWRHMTSAS